MVSVEDSNPKGFNTHPWTLAPMRRNEVMIEIAKPLKLDLMQFIVSDSKFTEFTFIDNHLEYSFRCNVYTTNL